MNDDGDPNDDSYTGHGTAMAGAACAKTNNDIGVASIAGASPYTRVMPLKVLDSTGMGHLSHVLEALEYGLDHGARYFFYKTLSAHSGVATTLVFEPSCEHHSPGQGMIQT